MRTVFLFWRNAHDLKSALFFRFEENLRQFHDFENFDALKCDLAKTSCAWPEKSVLYNFHGKGTVFSFSREFQARVTILRTLTLQNAIWPRPTAHDLKRAFCTIFMENTLFFRFEENLRPVSRFWELCTISMESLLFSLIGVNFCPLSNFRIWNVEKCDLAKTSSCLKSTFCTILMKSLLVSRIGVNFCPVERFWH